MLGHRPMECFGDPQRAYGVGRCNGLDVSHRSCDSRISPRPSLAAGVEPLIFRGARSACTMGASSPTRVCHRHQRYGPDSRRHNRDLRNRILFRPGAGRCAHAGSGREPLHVPCRARRDPSTDRSGKRIRRHVTDASRTPVPPSNIGRSLLCTGRQSPRAFQVNRGQDACRGASQAELLHDSGGGCSCKYFGAIERDRVTRYGSARPFTVARARRTCGWSIPRPARSVRSLRPSVASASRAKAGSSLCPRVQPCPPNCWIAACVHSRRLAYLSASEKR